MKHNPGREGDPGWECPQLEDPGPGLGDPVNWGILDGSVLGWRMLNWGILNLGILDGSGSGPLLILFPKFCCLVVGILASFTVLTVLLNITKNLLPIVIFCELQEYNILVFTIASKNDSYIYWHN